MLLVLPPLPRAAIKVDIPSVGASIPFALRPQVSLHHVLEQAKQARRAADLAVRQNEKETGVKEDGMKRTIFALFQGPAGVQRRGHQKLLYWPKDLRRTDLPGGILLH